MFDESEFSNNAFEHQTVQYGMQLRLWLRVVGFFNLVLGVLACLTICNAFTGVIQILLGMLALRAADRIAEYVQTGEEHALRHFLEDMRNKYLVMGLQSILAAGVVLMYLMFVFLYILAIVVILVSSSAFALAL